jgi:SPP1 gp7 family putative phage head morphogenesis protein
MRSLPFIVDRVVLRVSAELADNVRDALRESININEIVDAFLATFPSDTPTRSQARDWARMNVRQNEKPLARVLDDVWASGWVLGTDYATEAMRLAAIKKAPTFSIDWSKWKPGQPAAEAVVRPPRGLKRLLQRSRNKTIKGISDTNLDRIGTVLADGLAAGADSRSVARELMELGIKGILDDAKRALTIALTETSRAVGEATVERYQEMGLRRFEWITVEGEGVCEACDENAEAGPISVGEAFPSGDYHEPAHPNCRCKMAPFIEGFSTPIREMAERGATADVVKYDEDQPRDENGRFGSGGSDGLITNYDPNDYDVDEGRVPDENAQAQFAERQQGEYAKYLAKDENFQSVLYDYMDETFYGKFNEELRSGEYSEQTEQHAYTLMNAINNESAVFDQDITVFRGVEGSTEFSSLKVGDIMIDGGFMSTSTNPLVAESFTMKYQSGEPVFMSIQVPAGTYALALDPIHNAAGNSQDDPFMRELGGFGKVNEILFPPGTKLEITNVSREFGGLNVTAKVVGQDVI